MHRELSLSSLFQTSLNVQIRTCKLESKEKHISYDELGIRRGDIWIRMWVRSKICQCMKTYLLS